MARFGPDLRAVEDVADAFGGLGGWGWFWGGCGWVGDFGWAGAVGWGVFWTVIFAERFGAVETVAEGNCVIAGAFDLRALALGVLGNGNSCHEGQKKDESLHVGPKDRSR